MNPKVTRVLMYIFMPIIFVVIGYVLLFVGGKDFITMVREQVTMAMTKGAPDYPNGFDESLFKETAKTGNVEQWSEVPLPALDTSYAILYSENLNIQTDVYYGDTEEAFAKGVGQYTGSHLFGCGKPILIGGHDTTYFAGLEQAKAGDIFVVKTNYGEYTYEVTATRIAKASDSSAYDLKQQEEQMILYTCYPFGEVTKEREQRFFVYCKRVDNGNVIKEVPSGE